MKLLIVIINNEDSQNVLSALTENGYAATKLATSGGFLRAGNTTLMIGVDDEKVDQVISVIGDHSRKRTQMISPAPALGMEYITAKPVEVTVGGATVFVIDIEKYIKL